MIRNDHTLLYGQIEPTLHPINLIPWNIQNKDGNTLVIYNIIINTTLHLSQYISYRRVIREVQFPVGTPPILSPSVCSGQFYPIMPIFVAVLLTWRRAWFCFHIADCNIVLVFANMVLKLYYIVGYNFKYTVLNHKLDFLLRDYLLFSHSWLLFLFCCFEYFVWYRLINNRILNDRMFSIYNLRFTNGWFIWQ